MGVILMNKELKPCPFCGGEKLKIESKKGEIHYSKKDGMYPWHNVKYSVRCNSCHARGGVVSAAVPTDRLGEYSNKVYEVREKAVEAWNRRVNDETD